MQYAESGFLRRKYLKASLGKHGCAPSVKRNSKKKGANTNPGKPGSQKIDKSEVKLFVTA